ncbi:MAG: methyltransferase domain-containing protein, partial [Bacteroidota bacterium]
RFLSIFYDKLVNPLFWTPWMREQSLELGDFSKPDLSVIDVGSGTGFTTEGIVRRVASEQVTCVDQSPHQMAKAKAKKELLGCTFIVGDAEQVPAETDAFDRYVSAGSIEYWPNPQQGINESYRVIKPGGKALMIGPMQPKTTFMQWVANTWMLFPTFEEYKHWYEQAGFTDIEYRFVQPHWYPDKDGYAVAIVGVKPQPGLSPNPAPANPDAEIEDAPLTFGRALVMAFRVIVGSTAGFIFIPIALLGYLVNGFGKQDDRPPEFRERLNTYQILALLVILGLILAGVWSFLPT